MPQQSHRKGREREPREGKRGDHGSKGQGGVEERENVRKGRRVESERTQSRAEKSGTERGKRSSEGRAKKKESTHHQRRQMSTRTDTMAPSTGTSRAEWRQTPGLDHLRETAQCHGLEHAGPGRNHKAAGPVPLDLSIAEEEETSRQAEGAQIAASGGEREGRQQGPSDWNIRGPEALDWNIQG